MAICSDESEKAPIPSVEHFGGTQQVDAKGQTIVLRRGQASRIQVTFRDALGNPLDMSDCADSGEGSSVTGDYAKVLFRMVDPTSRSSEAPLTREGTLLSPSTGVAVIQLTKADVSVPGIYVGEVAAVQHDDDEEIITSTQLCLWIEPGLFGAGTNLMGPPQLSDVRLRLRDYAPENELIDTVDFDSSEITHALVAPINDYNEATPNLRKKYTTQDFPHRGAWLSATCGYLFRIAAEHYRRNRLPYQAGGSNIDDKAKAQEYDQRGDGLIAEWKQFIKATKIAANIAGGFGGIGSGYNRYGGRIS